MTSGLLQGTGGHIATNDRILVLCTIVLTKVIGQTSSFKEVQLVHPLGWQLRPVKDPGYRCLGTKLIQRLNDEVDVLQERVGGQPS